jgi:hypothetical protein
MAPSPTTNDTIVEILAFMENIWPTEAKDVEKRVIVKFVDRCKGWTVLRQASAGFTHEAKKLAEGIIPRVL